MTAIFPTKARLMTLEGKTVSLPTHLEMSRPKPLALPEFCRVKSFFPSFANRTPTQSPIGLRTASELK
jgi:hypothetical protein